MVNVILWLALLNLPALLTCGSMEHLKNDMKSTVALCGMFYGYGCLSMIHVRRHLLGIFSEANSEKANCLISANEFIKCAFDYSRD